MKKLFALMLAIALVLAICSTAYAIDIPTDKIALTVQPVDYTYALAGYAQPVSKAYVANERYAVLVSIEIPGWIDTGGLALEVTPKNCTVENADALALADGNYIITGTVLTTGATVKVTIKDKALDTADTANELWAALYGDRSVSATATLGVTTTATQTVTGIPKTGAEEDIRLAVGLLTSSALVLTAVAYMMFRRDRHA